MINHIKNKRQIVISLAMAVFPACLITPLFFINHTYVVFALVYFLAFSLIFVVRAFYQTFDQDIANKMRINYQQIQAFISLNSLLKPNMPLPPMRGSVISPDIANILAATIMKHRPEVIVECGSGISTLISGYCVQKNGHGHIWSLEHEKEYAAITQENLNEHGLAQHVEVLFAPLKEYTINEKRYLFYDSETLKQIDSIDLLFIDGPPRTIYLDIRYPALPLLAQKLSPNSIIILDDAARHAEKKIVNSWLKQFPDLKFQEYNTEKGTAMFFKSTS